MSLAGTTGLACRSVSNDLTTIPTPCLVLDQLRCSGNAARMAARMSGLGVALRPHLKTAKSTPVARLAVAGHLGGVTVSTLAEARHLAAAGLDDVRLAVCPSPAVARGAARLAADGVRISVIVDDPAMVACLAAEAGAASVVLPTLVEIDCGEHRTGLRVDGSELLEVARAVHAADSLALAGVLTHAGHAYDAATVGEVVAIAEQERATVVAAAERLRAAGLPCDEVSAGSTPTATHAADLSGVTEMRPGVYLFGDGAQVQLGSCALEDVALTVLATVISNRAGTESEAGRPGGALILDAGGLALSKDRSTATRERGSERVGDIGYGLVCDVQGHPLRRSDGRPLIVDDVHQEHGAVHGVDDVTRKALPLGARVRVMPNHACMTAAAHDRYHVVRGDDLAVVDIWERCNGWGGT